MKSEYLWSLRLGFSGEQASKIKNRGFEAFLDQSLTPASALTEPDFLKDTPRTLT